MRYYGSILLLLMLSVPALSQTYYYERVAVVKNGIKSSASGDGHFITFTAKGCYDSDREGFSEDTGFRQYKSTENNIRSYYGDSYFGNAYYYFNPDRTRLNIKRESDGATYVYVRKTPPAGVTKSSRKKEKANVPTIVPIIPSVTNVPTPSFDFSEPSSGSKLSRYGYYTCPNCHGSGLCPICHGRKIADNSYTGGYNVCNSCTGGRCSACGGTGKKYGVIQ